MSNNKIRIVGWAAVGMLITDIILILFDIPPDWWYQGWIWQPWSVATGKIIALISATVFIVVISAILGYGLGSKQK